MVKHIDFDKKEVTETNTLEIGEYSITLPALGDMVKDDSTLRYQLFGDRALLCEFINNNNSIIIEDIIDDDKPGLWYWL